MSFTDCSIYRKLWNTFFTIIDELVVDAVGQVAVDLDSLIGRCRRLGSLDHTL
jgi:hypothetical protein